MAKNSVYHSKTRYNSINYHFIREAIGNGDIQLKHYKSEEQVANIFTRALPKVKFHRIRKLSGVEEHHIKGRILINVMFKFT